MYIQYGNYVHAIGECWLTEQRTPEYQSGILVGSRYRFDVYGRIQIDDTGNMLANQAAMTLALNSLEAAYAVNGLDFGLYQDNGAPTDHGMASSDTIGGTKVVAGVNYPQGHGAEYSTFRNYTVSIEGIVPINILGTIAFHETLNVRGGGPEYIWLECLNGPPQLQIVKEQTTYRATQEGHAIGAYACPLPPPPLWPQYYLPAQSGVTPISPELVGPLGALQFRNFGISWRYEFASDIPLIGSPNNWNPNG